ncbi:hypothetical protein DNTS_008413, partial [Danionella cerebrum]
MHRFLINHLLEPEPCNHLPLRDSSTGRYATGVLLTTGNLKESPAEAWSSVWEGSSAICQREAPEASERLLRPKEILLEGRSYKQVVQMANGTEMLAQAVKDQHLQKAAQTLKMPAPFHGGSENKNNGLGDEPELVSVMEDPDWLGVFITSSFKRAGGPSEMNEELNHASGQRYTAPESPPSLLLLLLLIAEEEQREHSQDAAYGHADGLSLINTEKEHGLESASPAAPPEPPRILLSCGHRDRREPSAERTLTRSRRTIPSPFHFSPLSLLCVCVCVCVCVLYPSPARSDTRFPRAAAETHTGNTGFRTIQSFEHSLTSGICSTPGASNGLHPMSSAAENSLEFLKIPPGSASLVKRGSTCHGGDPQSQPDGELDLSALGNTTHTHTHHQRQGYRGTTGPILFKEVPRGEQVAWMEYRCDHDGVIQETEADEGNGV